MKITKKDKITFISNCLLALLEILGTIFLFTIPLDRGKGMSVASWTTFKFFTTDSNIVMLVACIISIVYMLLVWNKKIKQIPQWVHIFKLIATTGVALTMFITVFVLTPGAAIMKKYPAPTLYLGSNLLFHLLNPIVAILVFLLFENRKDVKLIKTLYSLIPIVAYGIFYATVAYTHVNPDGTIPSAYDWYTFCSYGPGATVGIFIGIIGIFYLFTWLLWLGNKKIQIKF